MIEQKYKRNIFVSTTLVFNQLEKKLNSNPVPYPNIYNNLYFLDTKNNIFKEDSIYYLELLLKKDKEYCLLYDKTK